MKETRNVIFDWVRDRYAVLLDWCLGHPAVTMIGATLIFGATLLIVPFIGGEFLPHLDEGALWIRATMPYTISFEEAAAFSPKIRAILMQYPQATIIASELGRPDDGTDPTGFFNDEFYMGLKPYGDKSWKEGSIHTKAELTADLDKKLSAYPGVIFNYTQPAEDAVDEALTGLKSSLAVKVFGPDLEVLEQKAIEIKRVLSQTPGFTELTVVRETGAAKFDCGCRSRQDRAVRDQCGRRGKRGAGRSRWAGGDAGDPGREIIRPGGADEAAIPFERD